ncbi:MAG: hypothetical protein FJ297_13680 [Planctomycetes bacterium]|nr:hypothetical protein [Planctomycetota bacterium]
MFVKAHAQHPMEVMKWAVLVVLAGALALVLASAVGGAERMSPPARLPDRIEDAARWMPVPPIPPAEPRPAEDPFERATAIWNAIELQRAGQVDEAVEAWIRLRLPEKTDVWRLVALAYAHMPRADHAAAADVLSEAKYAAPENAVVHFAIGTLWLAKAESAYEWRDSPNSQLHRLAAWGPIDVAPNTKSMYRLAAVMSFERAAESARNVNLDEPLIEEIRAVPEADDLAMPIAAPTVRDLLSAFEADAFEGRSHLALGVLHAERNMLAHAERHLDQAAALGQPTGAEFRDLGARYEESAQFSHAARAYLKAMSHGGGVGSLGRALENAGRAVLR